MPHPAATTWLLLLLVLLPTGALAWLGFQAADAYDAADATRLRTELETGRRHLEEACAREAAALERRLQEAVANEAAFVAAHPGEEAVGRVAARLQGAGVRRVRLVDARGVGLWPAEHVPAEGGVDMTAAPTSGTLLAYLRREADRAYYSAGGYAAAEAVWQTAAGRLQAASLRRLVQIETARLRVRAGLAQPATALRALHERWGGAPTEVAGLGRPYLLLRMEAAQEDADLARELARDVQAGHTVQIPLTKEERRRLETIAAQDGSAEGAVVALEAAVAHGARLIVWFDSASLRRALSDQIADISPASLWASVGHAADAAAGVLSVPLLGAAPAQVFYGHRDAATVRASQKKRRWVLSGAVILLFSVTLLGLGLTRRAVASERAARRLRDEFIANVTHEVRTPLTSVLLHSEILAAEGTASAQRQEHAAVVKAQGRRLAQLVDDMLDFSALERGTRRLEAVPVDVGAACREASAPLCVLAAREGTQLSCDIEGEEVAAMADPAALARILANLLGNAWKHGRPSRDGSPGRIRVHAYEDGERVLVDVRDDGPGLPALEREQIFARFGRGRGAHGKEGAGIGLALSRDLAEAMGGELDVIEEGSETVFRLRLPSVPALSLSVLEEDA